jgi:glutathione S-transferase
VVLRWARMTRQDVPEPLPAFAERMEARPAVQLALRHEGLS